VLGGVNKEAEYHIQSAQIIGFEFGQVSGVNYLGQKRQLSWPV
jgi:hypothetical protein